MSAQTPTTPGSTESTSTTPASAETRLAVLTPEEFGVGCRFSLYPMCDDFAAVILAALGEVDATGLEVRTDDVSTYLAGPENRIVDYVREVLVAAAQRTPHVVATVLLSRGCPGEVTCELDGEMAASRMPPPPRLAAAAPTGVLAAAHWSVYALGVDNYMDLIGAAVEQGKADGTYAGGEHYVTRLEGDVADVLATIAGGWLAAAGSARHVAAHATVSVGSPTSRTAEEVRR